ncbi:MAG: glycosyltransferase family 2 protein [Pseudomonadota bacterium]
MSTADQPLVTIVMAAYNRADMLRFAVQSVLQSTYRNWELAIVGDACTDHTEEVIAGFNDPRISFENRSENSGGQATPNNHGLAKARGDLILFLNQDDMYLPWHIERAVAHMQTTGSDVSWCPLVLVETSGKETGPPDPDIDRLTLDGFVDKGGYDPRQFYLASSWALRSSAMEVVGPWKTEDECRWTPSQDWLFRAHQTDLKITYRADPTVVAIHSGARRLSYRKPATDHARLWSWISQGEAGIAQMLATASVTLAADLHSARKALRGQIDNKVDELARLHGIHPLEVSRFLAGEAKGDFIRKVRAHTVEAPIAPTDARVEVGLNAADIYFADGWYGGEGTHRWSSAPRAEFFFASEGPCKALRVNLHPRAPGQTVSLSVNDRPKTQHTLPDGQTVELPLSPDDRLHRVTVEVDTCLSPLEMGTANDPRPLGLVLQGFEVLT